MSKSGADEIKGMILEWLEMPENKYPGMARVKHTVECPSCRQFVGSNRDFKLAHIPQCRDELVRRIRINSEGEIS